MSGRVMQRSLHAHVELLPTGDGVLREPMPSPTQSLLLRLDGSTTDIGVLMASDSGGPFTPGTSVKVTLIFWAAPPEIESLSPDRHFTLRYPTRVVAHGRVQDDAQWRPMSWTARQRPSCLTACDDQRVADDVITPEQISHGRVVRDDELPELAAQWLVEGYDSPLLRELAGLSRREAIEARQLLPHVLAELGSPITATDVPHEDLPWRGCWEGIWWAVDRMDRTHSPYASAQYVLEIVRDVPDLWAPVGGDELMRLLSEWDQDPVGRPVTTERLRAHLRSFRETDVPPLSAPEGRVQASEAYKH